MKKVLGISASPRHNGNCEMLLKEALLEIEDTEKEIIRLSGLNLQYCRACYRCLPEGSPCVLDDDFNPLMDKISAADGIILAAPLYYLGPNSSLKLLLDRFLSQSTEGKRFRGKPCLTITTYGIKDWQGFGQVFSNLFAHFLTLDLKGSYLIKSSYPGEYLKDMKTLSQIRTAAANLFNPDFRENPALNHCPACLNPYLSIEEEGGVWCPSCGIRGILEQDETGKIRTRFSDRQNYRFEPDRLHHHFAVDLQHTIQEFLSKKQALKEYQSKFRDINW